MSSVQESFTELALLAREEKKELALLLSSEETLDPLDEAIALLLGDETRELRAEDAHGQVSVKRKSGCSTPSIGSTEILMVCGPGLTSALPQFQTSGGLPKQ